MKDYTNMAPVFSEIIRVTEPTDPGHADNINPAPMQLLQNTLANREYIKSLEEVLEKLLTRGMIFTNFVTVDRKQFVTSDGKAFRAAKKIQFR